MKPFPSSNSTLTPLGRYAARIRSARDQERQRIARDIHDVLGSTLVAMKLETTLVCRALDARNQTNPDLEIARLLQRLSTLSSLTDEAISFTRQLISDPAPAMLSRRGLIAAIETHATDFSRRTNIACTVSSHEDIPEPEPAVSQALFRILQEALTNVIKHARASRVFIRLRQRKNRLEMEIEDDGEGFLADQPPAPTSQGVRNIRERIKALEGMCLIESEPGAGTRIRVSVDNRQGQKTDQMRRHS